MSNVKSSYCFDDVLLVPKYSDVISRGDIDLTSYLDENLNFRLPVISSPMDTVTETDMAVAMNGSGGLGIIHRYNTIEEQSSLVYLAREICGNVGGSIGVSGDYLERAKALISSGANVICVDIAHGHHAMMRSALRALRSTIGIRAHIMAGNVATLEGFNDLADWGANSIRVGIGGGSICSTRIQTGHGVPTFQSILDCSQSDRDVGLIADGGIRNSGDVVKAYSAGADFVMLGSMLAGCTEAPGEIIHVDGDMFKSYRGMASKDAQIGWRGHVSSIEGVSSIIPCAGSVSDVLSDIETGIRSGLSYSGAHNIRELQSRSSFISQTSAGSIESSTHINNH